MAADEKKFASFDVFLSLYEKKIQNYECALGGKEAETLKKAALALIQGIRAGIPVPGSSQATNLGQFYYDMRNELGLSDKSLQAHVAKSPDHYHLALIARDMFDAILNSEIELGSLTRAAIKRHQPFLEKRRKEIDSLIKDHEGRINLQQEMAKELFNNAGLILQHKRGGTDPDPVKREHDVKPGITIEHLTEFVTKTEELVERTFSLPDRKPLISEGQVYSEKMGYQTTPRAKLFNTIFLPDSKYEKRVSSSNPFYQFKMAIEKFENSTELDMLKNRMDRLEETCRTSAPMAATRAEFCDAYAANEASGKKGGLFPWHQSIAENLRLTLAVYEKSRSGFFTFKRPEKVQQIMGQLKEIHALMGKDYAEIASHYYSSEQLVSIIHNFKQYEQELRKMQDELVGEFKTLGKAEKEEEYKIIHALYHEIVNFNVMVEKEICAKFRDQIQGLPSLEQVQQAPLAQEQAQQAPLAQRRLGGK